MTTIEHHPAQPVSQDWDWQLRGACRGLDVEIFFHPAGERRRDKAHRINHAKWISHRCPVIDACAAWALRTREPYGVWGGLSEDERAQILGVRSLRYPARVARQQRDVGAGLIDQIDAVWTALRSGSPTTGSDVVTEMLGQRAWAVRQLTTAADLTRAMVLGQTVAADMQRVLGPDHPDTLTSRNNLAYAYQSAGRLTDAIPLYERTLADRQRVLGPDHPDTLGSRNNLAAAHALQQSRAARPEENDL